PLSGSRASPSVDRINTRRAAELDLAILSASLIAVSKFVSPDVHGDSIITQRSVSIWAAMVSACAFELIGDVSGRATEAFPSNSTAPTATEPSRGITDGASNASRTPS